MKKILPTSLLIVLSITLFGQNIDTTLSTTKSNLKFADYAYANLLEFKGWHNERIGKYEKAMEYYRKALAIHPNSDDIPGKMDRTQKKIQQDIALDKSPPEVQLLTPKVIGSLSLETDEAEQKELFVSGTIKDLAGVAWININGTNITEIKTGGYFSLIVQGSPSKLNIQTSDIKGNISTQTYTINHTTKSSFANNTSDEKIPFITPDDNPKFYAVIIACSDYNSGGWSPLPTTIEEAKLMKNVLVKKYGFDSINITELYNKDYIKILSTLSSLLESLKENDNLIIYFAGHGTYKTKGTELVGYWVPLYATNIDVDYISSKKLDELIAGSRAKHILMLSDACYSGAMRSREEVKTPSKWEYKLRSRQVLTSGGLEKVPGQSVFIKMVMDALQKNEAPYLPVSELYSIIYSGVKKQANTEPKLTDFGSDGNEGGQFYFIKKN
ncbi:MAG TPA: caspase family protein [Chitinophagales bacterium]|nr:caspase family protein [Chitinophagales bacterium]